MISCYSRTSSCFYILSISQLIVEAVPIMQLPSYFRVYSATSHFQIHLGLGPLHYHPPITRRIPLRNLHEVHSLTVSSPAAEQLRSRMSGSGSLNELGEASSPNGEGYRRLATTRGSFRGLLELTHWIRTIIVPGHSLSMVSGFADGIHAWLLSIPCHVLTLERVYAADVYTRATREGR